MGKGKTKPRRKRIDASRLIERRDRKSRRADRSTTLPTYDECREDPRLWEVRVRGLSKQIDRSERMKNSAAAAEQDWRNEHRRTLALAANGGK